MEISRPPPCCPDFRALGLAVMTLWVVTSVSFATAVTFEDANFEALVRANLQIENGPVTTADMERLTTLAGPRRQIESLSGLEFATNLQSLHLRDNRVTDLTPLAGLTQLRVLNLRNNRVTDLSPLAELAELQVLGLRDNRVVDLSPLAAAVGMRDLDLRNNRITDLTPLADMEKLEVLGLRDNRGVADISGLAGKPRLRRLYLRNNRAVSDLSPLAGATALEWLSLRDCAIVDLRPLAGLVRLRTLDLHHNHLADISVLSGLPELQWVDLRRNHLHVTRDEHSLAALLLLRRRAETVHFSPQRQQPPPETALAVAMEIRALLEAQLALRLHGMTSLDSSTARPVSPAEGGLGATVASAGTATGTRELILFTAGVELTLLFEEAAEEMTLRFTGEENGVQIVGTRFAGIYTYVVDQPTEANLRIILERDDGRGLLHFYELDLIYGTPDTGEFDGWFESDAEDPRPLSGTFLWH